MEQNESVKKIDDALNSDEKKNRNIVLLGMQSPIKNKIIDVCKKEKDKCIEIDIGDLCSGDLEKKFVEQLNNNNFGHKRKLGILNKLKIGILNKLKININIKTFMGELEVENKDNESYGNLEKTLYFFQNTEYNVVLIDIMDKSNIVTNLRKLAIINRQINNNRVIKEKKGKVTFVYNITEKLNEDIDESVFFVFDYTQEINIEVLDLLFSMKDKGGEYSTKLDEFLKKILNRSKESIEFIQMYLYSGKNNKLLIPKLLEKSETIWEDIFFNESLQGETEKLDVCLAKILVYGNKEGIDRNDKGVFIESYGDNKKCKVNDKVYDIKVLHNFCELYDDYQGENIEYELEYEGIDEEESNLMYDYFRKHNIDVLAAMLDEVEVGKVSNDFLEEISCRQNSRYKTDNWSWLYECFHKMIVNDKY